MNTDFLSKHCHIGIPNPDKRALRLERIALTEAQCGRLLDWAKPRLNWGIVKTITASWVTYKRQRTRTIKVEWVEARMSHFFTEDEFNHVIYNDSKHY